MERRQFLQLGLAGGALLAVAGLGVAMRPPLRVPPRRPLIVLTPDQFSVLVAIAARVAPQKDPGAPDAVEIAQRVDDRLSMIAPESAHDLGKLLLLIDSPVFGLLLDGRPGAFTRLSGEAQDAALRDFRDSALVVRRTGWQALRKLCLSVYYEDPTTWPAVGYPGPPNLVALSERPI